VYLSIPVGRRRNARLRRVVIRKRMAQCAHIVLLFLAALSAVHAHTTVVGPLSSMPAVPVREHSYVLCAPNFTIVERHSTPGAFQRRPEFRGRGDTPLHSDRLAGCTVPDDPRKQSPDTLPTQEADVCPVSAALQTQAGHCPLLLWPVLGRGSLLTITRRLPFPHSAITSHCCATCLQHMPWCKD
jgi:hypothetical protein